MPPTDPWNDRRQRPSADGDGNRHQSGGERRCVVCSGLERTTVFREHGIDIVRCRGCGHVYSTHPTPQDYDGYFGDEPPEGEQFWWDTAHRAMYGAFGRRFLEGRAGRLLDVGCGLGFFVRFASGFPNWEAWGCEISPAAVAYARERLELANVHCGRIEEIDLPAGTFDLITLWDVIEHIPDPLPLLARLAELAEPGGTLFLHTPNIAVQLPKAKLKRRLYGMRPQIHYLEARDHINIYSPRSLEAVLHRSGFREVRFLHLPPLGSVSGSRNAVLKVIKRVWAASAAALHHLTLGSLNLDNLFVAARLGTTRPPGHESRR